MLVIQSNATELSIVGDFCRLQQGKMSKVDIKIKRVKSPLLGKKKGKMQRDRETENTDQSCFEGSVQNPKEHKGEFIP